MAFKDIENDSFIDYTDRSLDWMDDPPQTKPKPKPKPQNTEIAEKPISKLPIIIKNKETRSVRKQFLIEPSINEKATAICEELGTSLNEVINQLLRLWVSQNEDQ